MAQVDTMKTLQGWTDVTGHALPRPRRLRRADPAVDPLRRLDRRQRRGLGQELGALLAAGDPGLHPRLPRRDRRRPDQSRHRRPHDAGHPPAEAAGDATSALRCGPRARLHLGALSRAAPPERVVTRHGRGSRPASRPCSRRRRVPPASPDNWRRCRVANAQRCSLRRCICSGTCSAFSPVNK